MGGGAERDYLQRHRFAQRRHLQGRGEGVMLLSRQQLGALAFASTDPSRQALANLRIDPDGTVWATDGHTLARVRHIAPSEDEFPLILTIPAEAVSPTVSVLLPAS